VKIEIWIECEQRKLEPILPSLFAVTRTGIAAMCRQNRKHIEFKTHLRRLGYWAEPATKQ
jgi:hypothetical protein